MSCVVITGQVGVLDVCTRALQMLHCIVLLMLLESAASARVNTTALEIRIMLLQNVTTNAVLFGIAGCESVVSLLIRDCG